MSKIFIETIIQANLDRTMKKPFFARCFALPLVAAGFLATSLFAQQYPVEVSDVDFDGGGSDEPIRLTIELDAHSSDDRFQVGNYIKDVGVTVTVAWEYDAGQIVFFRSKVNLVGLEVGDSNEVAFFVPNETVEMYRLSRDPTYWYIQLSVGGQEIPSQSSDISSSLRAGGRAATFLSRANAEVEGNKGIMLPAYLTRFAESSDEPPSVIRADDIPE